MVGHNFIDQAINDYDMDLYEERRNASRAERAFERKYAKELRAAGVDKMDKMISEDDENRKQIRVMKKNLKEAKAKTQESKPEQQPAQVEKAAKELDKEQAKAREENLLKMKSVEKEQQSERDKAKQVMKKRGIHRPTPGRGARGR